MTAEQNKYDHDLLVQERELLKEKSLFTQKLVSENRLLFDQLTIVQEELLKQSQLILEHKLLLHCISAVKDLSVFKYSLSDAMMGELQKIILNNSINYQKVLYGAADRVKEGITYRLGATLIRESHSLKGMLLLPFKLSKMKKDYNNNLDNVLLEKLSPDLELYQDVSEGLKCKSHLSYRLGSVFEKKSTSVIGWIQMPFSLLLELRSFRRSK